MGKASVSYKNWKFIILYVHWLLKFAKITSVNVQMINFSLVPTYVYIWDGEKMNYLILLLNLAVKKSAGSSWDYISHMKSFCPPLEFLVAIRRPQQNERDS